MRPSGWRQVAKSDGAKIRQRVVGSAGAPETPTVETPWLPLERAEALDGAADWVPSLLREMNTTLAAAPLGDPRTALVVGRPGGPQFRPSEVARLGYLAGIVATILR